MNSPTLKPLIVRGKEDEFPAPSLWKIIGKSALLNVVIVLTSFPVLVFAGGPDAVGPALVIMAGISVVIWTATFTLFSLSSLIRIFWNPDSFAKRRDALHPAQERGVADRWVDEPF